MEAAHILQYTEDEFLQTLDWKPFGNEVGGSAKQLVVNPSGWGKDSDFFPEFGLELGLEFGLDWSAFEITDIDKTLFARSVFCFSRFSFPIWNAVKKSKIKIDFFQYF